MSLLTRCPRCDTLYRVTPAQLQVREGKVRCGRCMNVFDGFQALAVEEGDASSEPVRFDPERVQPTPPQSSAESVELKSPLVESVEAAPPAVASVETAPPTTTYIELVPSPSVFVEEAPVAATSAEPKPPAAASGEPAQPTTTYVELVSSPSASAAPVRPGAKSVEPAPSATASTAPARETVAARVEYVPPRASDIAPAARGTAPDFPRPRAPAVAPDFVLRARTPAEMPAATGAPRASVSEPIAAGVTSSLREKAADQARRLRALWRWKPVKPTETTGWIAASVVAVILLAFQLVYAARGELAARNPTLKAMFTSVCRVVGCRVPLPHNPELVKIEASDVRMVDSSRPQLVQLTATLRSYANHYLAFPALDLVLTNANEHALARRVFVPQEYLGRNRDPYAGLPPHAEITIALELDTGNQNAAGFRLDLLAAP